jgi:soluble lytic murein transglycosylase-like protein
LSLGVSRLLIFLGLASSFLLFPVTKAILQGDSAAADPLSAGESATPIPDPAPKGAQPATAPPRTAPDRAAGQAIENLLARYGVRPDRLSKTARAIVASGRKHSVDPRLLASIMIVESGADPNAVSPSDAVGIMQIHIPTWGTAANEQGIDLFNLEDNVDFGARILGDYILEYGTWEGVMRYKGWLPDNPASQQSAQDYAAKVHQIYNS